MIWSMPAKRKASIVLSLIGLTVVQGLLAGCGGGGSASGGAAGEQTLVFGDITSRAAGIIQPPIVAAIGDVAVTGLSGGDINRLAFQDSTPTLAETQILFST